MILIYLVCPLAVIIPFIILGILDSNAVILVGIYAMAVACYFDNLFMGSSKLSARYD